MIMRDMLEQKLGRFEELERQMADPEIQANGSKFSVAAREHGSLAKLATKYRKFKSLVEEVAELTEAMKPYVTHHNALLMANHGAVAYGDDLWQAWDRLETLEHTADGTRIAGRATEALAGELAAYAL